MDDVIHVRNIRRLINFADQAEPTLRVDALRSALGHANKLSPSELRGKLVSKILGTLNRARKWAKEA